MRTYVAVILLLLMTVLQLLSCKKESSCENGCDLNQPPVANAGPDLQLILPNNSLQLNGSGSYDPDNNITGYLWTKISGPSSFLISNNTQIQTQLTDLTEGRYEIELKVTDAEGLVAKDRIIITVIPSANSTILLDAGPDIIIRLPLDSVYLTASVSVSTATPEWQIKSGPAGATLSGTDPAFPGRVLIKNLIPGNYTLLSTVNSGSVLIADSVHVLVIADPQELNSISFIGLKWRLVDEYGLGLLDLDVSSPPVPNLFLSCCQLRPVKIFFQPDSVSSWIVITEYQSPPLSYYHFDAWEPHVWVIRIPKDPSWVNKTANLKIQIL